MKYTVREAGKTTSPNSEMTKADIDRMVGWFSNKHNVGGWVLTTLSAHDESWIKGAGQNDLTNLFRSFSDGGHTNIVKVNASKGTYAFMDSEHFASTDEIQFDKMTKYRDLFIDSEEMKSAFGV